MIKKLLLSTSLFLASHAAFSQGVAINEDNSSADASAILDVKSTTKGMLAPRMTEAQKNAITTPATGLLVFQTDATAGFYYYDGTAWTFINAAGVSGLNSLSRTTNEPAGANCATGGIKVEYGLDINRNGTLDAGEENAPLTKFVCNGATGATGAAGQGVPVGGTTGQVLTKVDGTNYNTQWTTPSTGGGGVPTLQLSATQTSQAITASVPTTVTWAETADPSNQFTGTIFTASSAGVYYINATFSIGFTSGAIVVIKKGSNIIAQTGASASVHTAGGDYTTRAGNISSMINLAVGETITIEVVTNNSGNTDTKGSVSIYKF